MASFGSPMDYNIAAEGLDPSRPTAPLNWGTGAFQWTEPGTERVHLWDQGMRYLGWIPPNIGVPGQPGDFQDLVTRLAGQAPPSAGESLYPPQWAWGLRDVPVAPGLTPPPGIQFSGNPAEKSVTLDPGTVRALLGTRHTQVGAQVPTYIAQQGGGAVKDYVTSTQPQTWQQHPAEWWQNPLLGLIPVVGSIPAIASGIEKGNLLQTLSGLAGVIGPSIGGIGVPGLDSLPGAGGPAIAELLGNVGLGGLSDFLNLNRGAGGAAGGASSLATAAGEIPGGAAGLTGGGFTDALAGVGTGVGIPQGLGVGSEFPGGLGAAPGAAPGGITDPAYWDAMAARMGKGDITSPDYWSSLASGLGAGLGGGAASTAAPAASFFDKLKPYADAAGLAKDVLGAFVQPGQQGPPQGQTIGMGAAPSGGSLFPGLGLSGLSPAALALLTGSMEAPTGGTFPGSRNPAAPIAQPENLLAGAAPPLTGGPRQPYGAPPVMGFESPQDLQRAYLSMFGIPLFGL